MTTEVRTGASVSSMSSKAGSSHVWASPRTAPAKLLAKVTELVALAWFGLMADRRGTIVGEAVSRARWLAFFGSDRAAGKRGRP